MIELQPHPRVAIAIDRLGLTKRQTEIVVGLSKGLRHDVLADHLKISRSTLRSHFRHIFINLNVANRVELLARVLTEVLEDIDTTNGSTPELQGLVGE